jgi:hypothetical protein
MIIDFENNCIWYRSENFQQKTHTPFSTNFKAIEILKDGRILVLEDYYKFSFEGKSNLYCLNRYLEVDWFLQFPNSTFDKDDLYVRFTSHGDKVFANSWECFRVEIDVSFGAIKGVEFTK